MKPPRTMGASPSAARLERILEQHAKVLSNISFGSTMSNADGEMNMQAHKVAGTTPGVINTEFAVTHTLKHIPIGFIVISTDKAGAHIYKSTTAWTAATNTSLGSIFLKCDVVTVAFSIVIL